MFMGRGIYFLSGKLELFSIYLKTIIQKIKVGQLYKFGQCNSHLSLNLLIILVNFISTEILTYVSHTKMKCSGAGNRTRAVWVKTRNPNH